MAPIDRYRRRRAARGSALCCWAMTLLAFPASAEDQPQDTSATAADLATVPALWKDYEFSFHYQSFTAFYSCDSLDVKVKRLLIAMGADPQLKVRSSGCEGGNTIASMPNVRIKMSVPAEISAALLADLERNRSRRELTARVRGERLKGGVEDQFPAYWKRVSLSRGALGLQPGDCELIDQLKRKVLPKLAIRIVKDDVHCTPGQLTPDQPRLEVEALTKVPGPEKK